MVRKFAHKYCLICYKMLKYQVSKLEIEGDKMDKKHKGKILITGNGVSVIDDLYRNISEDYTLKKCENLEGKFRKALEDFLPHGVIISLADETRETLRMYSILEDNPEHTDIPIIVIGKQEDCENFKRYIFQNNVKFFLRPFDRNVFFQEINEYISSKTAELMAKEARQLEEAARLEELRLLEQTMQAEKILIDKINSMTKIHGRKSILVVDDDVRMLNVIKLYLQDLYDVTVVPSGKLAIKYLSKKSADLVLLDYLMPDEDGPTVLQQIRQNTPNPNVPVLFLTGVADKNMVVRTLEFKPHGYLLKPVTREALLEKVTEILLDL